MDESMIAVALRHRRSPPTCSRMAVIILGLAKNPTQGSLSGASIVVISDIRKSRTPWDRYLRRAELLIVFFAVFFAVFFTAFFTAFFAAGFFLATVRVVFLAADFFFAVLAAFAGALALGLAFGFAAGLAFAVGFALAGGLGFDAGLDFAACFAGALVAVLVAALAGVFDFAGAALDVVGALGVELESSGTPAGTAVAAEGPSAKSNRWTLRILLGS